MRVLVIAGLIAATVALVRAETATESTVITSQRLSFDYRRMIAVFEEDVVVVDPQIRMESDRLNVLFEGSNQVKSITASGNVQMWHEDKTATCNRAIYVSRTSEVILQGEATLNRGGDSVMGDEITFSLIDDRMTCTPGRLIIGPNNADRDVKSSLMLKDSSQTTPSRRAPASGRTADGFARRQ
ncbi:MAG: hypothetical protein O3A51_07600 [Verrucomicrobia bacterium]|nr:hypothetical protein [Verrucomicrobiota bacterium]